MLMPLPKWCFWVTLPVAGVAVAIVLLVLPLKPVEGDLRRSACGQLSLLKANLPSPRKLLIVDYVGCALTLGGCALVLLPLIWVSI